jgi:hypothetical protein
VPVPETLRDIADLLCEHFSQTVMATLRELRFGAVQFDNFVELSQIGSRATPPQSGGTRRIDARLHQTVADDGMNGVPSPWRALAEVCGLIDSRSTGEPAGHHALAA